MNPMEIKLFNSYTNHLETFKPIQPNKVSMYVCGPTVYNEVHIGNLRPVVVFDVLRNLFTELGYRVTYVSNYTDIDDKIIQKSLEEKKSEKEITEHYIRAFEVNVKGIHSRLPDATPRVTEHLTSMIQFIGDLIKKNHAYIVDGDVYFRVKSIPEYGQLSNTHVDELLVGARVEKDAKKEFPLDFALWKKTEQGIQFPTPWGSGRPGWHTECVVMVKDVFKQHLIDIHGGGFDLKFPHHDNEIAQSLAMYGTRLANYWLHNGFINLNAQKMSKSTGNIVLAKDFLAQYGGAVLRYLLLSTHYRAPVNVAEDIIHNAQNEVAKITTAYKQLAVQLQLKKVPLKSKEKVDVTAFLSALSNDINTANGLTEVMNTIKDINLVLRNQPVDLTRATSLFFTISKMLNILGLDLKYPLLTGEDIAMYQAYLTAKQQKDFATSDALRKKLSDRQIL